MCAVLLVVSVLLAAAAAPRAAGRGAVEALPDASVTPLPAPSGTGRSGLELLGELVELSARTEGEDSAAERAMAAECLQLDGRCLGYLREHPAEARRALPDDPAYWRTYRAVLQAGPVSRAVEDLEIGSYSELISAERDLARYQLLTHGALDAADVHFRVTTHRRLLAESRFLIDKMVFIATAGIALQSINVVMAEAGVQPSPAETRLLDEMLEPLTTAELSLQRVMEEERRYGRKIMAQHREFVPDPLIWSDVEQFYEFVAGRSEAGWQSYWQKGLDVLAAVPGTNATELIPAFADYASNIRYLDATLHVLRALRPFYQGRAVPGIPATPAPALWYWAWRDDPEALCLEAGAVHPSLGTPEPICVPYLDNL